MVRRLEEGRNVVGTDRGGPVTKIVSIAERDPAAEGTRSALFTRLRSERVTNIGRLTRDQLHDDEP